MAVEIGEVVEGRITRLENYGAFVELPGGETGLLHVSEVSWTFVPDVRGVLRENDVVRVKVVGKKDGGRLDLSLKQLEDPPPRKERAPRDPQFEQMLKKFMRSSEQKLGDIRRNREDKRG